MRSAAGAQELRLLAAIAVVRVGQGQGRGGLAGFHIRDGLRRSEPAQRGSDRHGVAQASARGRPRALGDGQRVHRQHSVPACHGRAVGGQRRHPVVRLAVDHQRLPVVVPRPRVPWRVVLAPLHVPECGGRARAAARQLVDIAVGVEVGALHAGCRELRDRHGARRGVVRLARGGAEQPRRPAAAARADAQQPLQDARRAGGAQPGALADGRQLLWRVHGAHVPLRLVQRLPARGEGPGPGDRRALPLPHGARRLRWLACRGLGVGQAVCRPTRPRCLPLHADARAHPRRAAARRVGAALAGVLPAPRFLRVPRPRAARPLLARGRPRWREQLGRRLRQMHRAGGRRIRGLPSRRSAAARGMERRDQRARARRTPGGARRAAALEDDGAEPHPRAQWHRFRLQDDEQGVQGQARLKRALRAWHLSARPLPAGACDPCYGAGARARYDSSIVGIPPRLHIHA
mmetsp:Transcript_75351/g.207914  ORF Transcript_75351/g.207914 Transcript_75351/m.207914 type:complete len:461 (-) Transcript_75351:377-1759(-)